MPRKQHEFHFLYKTTNLVNGKYYVGMHSTSNLEDEYLGSGKTLRYSIRKHGRENHVREILEFLPDKRSLKSREKEIVNEKMLSDPLCMNLAFGGHGGFINKEAAKKGAKSLNEKIWQDSGFRERKSAETRKRNLLTKPLKRCDWTGRKMTEEHRQSIGKANSLSQKGERNSQYGSCWITDGENNKKIKSSELAFFLERGWRKGRLKR